ncbi:hypothetical protein BSFG_04649, partial [Bacteroides sp. 4_3_47FAA]
GLTSKIMQTWVVLTFSWNFNSGLKHKTEEKLMNNVDRETGIAR